MFHANLFPLIKHEPLPVFVYRPVVSPAPSNKPQYYQILGALAKRLTNTEKKPIISIEGRIESLAKPIEHLRGHSIIIPEVGTFNVELHSEQSSIVTINEFENYKALVNRLVDVSLTILSDNYYKFHPLAPYIIRDEPYFDKDLINETGILDSKKYYRTLFKFQNTPALLLNRETELRSYKNLLVEMQCLKRRFEATRKAKIDFYHPPPEFIAYINALLRGKAAEVSKSYPGPSIREIKEVTWQYRAKDVTPGSDKSPLRYLQENYGILDLDENQPLIIYEVGYEKKELRYHVPEVLSVGHTFKDLEQRIPAWQRTQVWGTIHPDCKNQLQKIYSTLLEIDSSLRENLPDIYPTYLEISTQALEVSTGVISPQEITLEFGNKKLTVSPPYDLDFYKKYSGKNIQFVDPMPSIKALVHVNESNDEIEQFLADLKDEYKLRNGTELEFTRGTIDFDKPSDHQLMITIDTSEDQPNEAFYDKCKKIIQNRHGKLHQQVISQNANKDSVMQIVMALSLKFGQDSWLLSDSSVFSHVVGVYTYSNPENEEIIIFANILRGDGKMVKHYGPFSVAEKEHLLDELIDFGKEKRVLYLFSFDRLQLTTVLKDKIQKLPERSEYVIAEVIDEKQLRFFETWIPKSLPRFGKAARSKEQINRSPMESQENAPQGVALQADDNTFYLLTGRTIEKGAMKRGCPTPIKLKIVEAFGSDWDFKEIMSYIFKLCLMGRGSGHMTRFPSPIYYLQSYAYYANRFGLPHGSLKERIFYI